MRCTCAAPRGSCSPELVPKLRELGIEPIVTAHVVRAVYDGPSKRLGKQIVALFEQEPCHDIVADGLEQNEHTEEVHQRKKKKKKRR